MGSIFGTPVRIFVPASMHPITIEMIASEGATVTQIEGNYEEAILTVFTTSQKDGGVLIQDTALEHYEEIPQATLSPPSLNPTHPSGLSLQRIVDGYTTPPPPPNRSPHITTVEPDTAPCLHPALSTGTPDANHHGRHGLRPGPVPRPGVSAACTVSAHDGHQAVRRRTARAGEKDRLGWGPQRWSRRWRARWRAASVR
ncbi:tryptophan synthase beta subunit-like PLP-dependent enzyme [Neofusicoccum parvum]|nr:tryptophan synthase beta subunit-like PLP-dependent enzyme [Neofusicoccum parvum]